MSEEEVFVLDEKFMHALRDLRKAVEFYYLCRKDKKSIPTGAMRDSFDWIVESSLSLFPEKKDGKKQQ